MPCVPALSERETVPYVPALSEREPVPYVPDYATAAVALVPRTVEEFDEGTVNVCTCTYTLIRIWLFLKLTGVNMITVCIVYTGY